MIVIIIRIPPSEHRVEDADGEVEALEGYGGSKSTTYVECTGFILKFKFSF